MDNNENKEPINVPSRRKFVWAVGILSAFAALRATIGKPFLSKKNPPLCKSENKPAMVKMLTQDGRLVEIDQSLLPANRKKVTDTELKNWIKKQKT